MMPSPAPIYVPTPVPSPPPSIFCALGTSFDGSSCSPCPVGYYSHAETPPWPSTCTLCPAGKFSNQPGSSQCTLCSVGKLSSPDRVSCADCKAGEYNKENVECASCEPGRYAPQPLSGGCLQCAAGSFTNGEIGATTCTPCNSGFYSLGGVVECAPCPPGQFSTSGQSACIACEAGKWAATSGSSSCTPCALGYDSREGAAECAQADSGFFLVGGVTTPCPANSECGGGTAMPIPSMGYWCDRRSLKFAKDIFKCPRSTCTPKSSSTNSSSSRRLDAQGNCWDQSSYPGGSAHAQARCDSDKLLCMPGANGALCGSCDRGFIYSSAERVCIACDVSQLRVLVVLGTCAGCALVALAVFAHIRTGGDVPQWLRKLWLWGVLRQVDGGALRVAWANYQVSLAHWAYNHLRSLT
jgi:hypothetical protein